MLGILESKSLWATSIRYLNDSAEYEYAIGVANTVIQKERDACQNQQDRDLLESIKSEVEYASSENDVFVISFSEEGDLLSQWRAYCPPTGGFSIGFVSEKLARLAALQHFVFAQCIYDEGQQRGRITQLLKTALQDFQEDQTDQESKSILWASIFKDELVKMAPIFKHPSFSEEREWRLICSVSHRPAASCGRASGKTRFIPQVRFREGISMIVPYIVFQLSERNEDIPIQKVIVGPTPHPALSKDSVLSMFTEPVWNTAYMDVDQSLIPYRAW